MRGDRGAGTHAHAQGDTLFKVNGVHCNYTNTHTHTRTHTHACTHTHMYLIYSPLPPMQGGLIAAHASIQRQDLFTGLVLSAAAVKPLTVGPVISSIVVISDTCVCYSTLVTSCCARSMTEATFVCKSHKCRNIVLSLLTMYFCCTIVDRNLVQRVWLS